ADATPYLMKALRVSGEDGPKSRLASIQALLGLSLANTGQDERARMHLENALALDAGHAEAHRTLADIYFGDREYAKAKSHYKKALETITDDHRVYNNLGIILSMDQDYKQAAARFEKALELEPD